MSISIMYQQFSNILIEHKKRHLPIKKVRFNFKYKHSNSEWITPGIIRSIEFRNSLRIEYINAPLNTKRKIGLENKFK